VNREIVILITLVVYKLVLVGIGVFASRRTKDGADFFLGGRKLGPWVAAISASASSSSAWTLMGVSGMAFTSGLASIWLFPACVGGFVLNWYLVAPKLQQLSRADDSITVTEFLAGKGQDTRNIVVLASVIVLLSLVTYVGSQFLAAGKAFENTFREGLGLHMNESILIGAGIILFYTLLGGFWAVSLTDTLQGLLMALTSVLLPLAALHEVGGFAKIIDGLRAIDPTLLSTTRHAAVPAAVGFVFGLLGIGLGYPGQPHVVNRFMALRPGGIASARRIAITWAVIVYAGMIVLGLCGRVLYDGVLADNENVFTHTTKQLFDPVTAGIMIAAVLSAIMSTADSQLLVAASSVTHDLGIGGRKRAGFLLRSRLTVVVISVLATMSALYGNEQIFSKVLFAWSAMGAAFGPLLLVTVLVGPVRPRPSLIAMASGFALSVLAYALRQKDAFGDLWIMTSYGTVFERILPFLVALAIASWGVERRAQAVEETARS